MAEQEQKTMRALIVVVIVLASATAAKADCLEDLGRFHEQVDSQNQQRPTAQSQAAARELQKLEHDEAADEIDCYNTLARARKILAAPFPAAADDQYAKDHRR